MLHENVFDVQFIASHSPNSMPNISMVSRPEIVEDQTNFVHDGFGGNVSDREEPGLCVCVS